MTTWRLHDVIHHALADWPDAPPLKPEFAPCGGCNESIRRQQLWAHLHAVHHFPMPLAVAAGKQVAQYLRGAVDN
jgi:hypothetical protein